ncbi:MAG: hypothetical protein JW787_14365 [Sedimentisphaerales bacterium]|nr:hypothetical protein [Sedimentisphaerales bacterium]
MENEQSFNGENETEQQILSKNVSDLTLCYLICPQDASNAFLGALMITDFRARPVHFSYVSPIRPTVIQRILFGSTLNSHVKIDVIAQKLLSGIPRVPDVVFVDDQEILSIKRLIKKPTACLKKNDTQDSDPTKLSILDYKAESNEDQEIIGQIIATLENQIDLIEPFSRMRQALKEAIKSPDVSNLK